MIYLYIGMGGFLGAVLRYLIGLAIPNDEMTLPLATLTVNLVGSFLLAFITFYLFEKYALSLHMKSAITTGLLGSFTTFSTLSVEVVELLEENLFMYAFLYVVISLFGGILMAYLGYLCQRKVVRE